jgi:HEAT repeat protein
MPSLPYIDRLSFWLGFLAATIIWWLLFSLRRYWPAVRNYAKKQIELSRLRTLTSVEDRLRRETLRRVQGMHLASPLFSLDEILITPCFLAPPAQIEPDMAFRSEPVISQLIPYLPDWNEVPAQYHYPHLSLSQALDGKRNLAILGQPGSGKTVALCYLAALIAREDEEAGNLATALPIFLHANDLNIPAGELADPLAPILQAASDYAPVMILPQVPGFLRSAFNQGEVAFLLDGLDELPPVAVREKVAYLGKLLAQYPGLRIIVTASSEYIDGLIGLGFAPLVVAGWDAAQQEEFIHRWETLWERNIVPDIFQTDAGEDIDPIVLGRWLMSDNYGLTPLELTLKAWALFAGDVRGPAPNDLFEAYLQRVTPDARYRPALERMAFQLIKSAQSCVPRGHANALVAEVFKSSASARGAEDASNVDGSSLSNSEAQTATEDREATIQRVIPALAENGLLVMYLDEKVGFFHPVIEAYLASRAIPQTRLLEELDYQIDWVVRTQILRHIAPHEDLSSLISAWLPENGAPLFREFFTAARWLRDAPVTARWRTQMMRSLLDLVQREDLPMGARFQTLAAFAHSKDPSVAVLFRQMLSSPSPELRRIAALGCGLLRDVKAVDALIGLLNDYSSPVRQSACHALVSIETSPAIQAVLDALMHGEEDLRRAAAESLANSPAFGYDYLREASASEDLLSRRASVFGLVLIPQPWAREILEKMRIEDGQWVVRNAAVQALEDLDLANARIPRPMPVPSQSPWLVTFASKQGVGIIPGQDVTDLLLQALHSGTPEERLAAMDYLRAIPKTEVTSALNEEMVSQNGDIREATFYTLWAMALSGAPMPVPA